jgi:tight adherence protein C
MLVLFASVVLGVGGWLMLVGLAPARPSLSQLIAASQDPPLAEEPVRPAHQGSWSSRYGACAVRPLARLGLPGSRTRAELELIGMPVEQLLAEKASAAVAGSVAPLVAFALVSVAGFVFPPALPISLSLLLAAVMFFVPDLSVHAAAEQFRAEARMAVRMFLDLTVTTLAGGAGIEQAMLAAAHDGHGPTFRGIREALAEARRQKTAAWPYLNQLGMELGVRELSELAATATLAGTEGAKAQTSIAVKARAMRERELTARIAEAESATERGGLPGVVLGLALIVYILFAALAAATTAL